MKKIHTYIFLCIALTGLLLCGCGSNYKNDCSRIRINNHSYDLSKDTDRVISDMVKNGLYVMDSNYVQFYDKSGNPGNELLDNTNAELYRQKPCVNVYLGRFETVPDDELQKILSHEVMYKFRRYDDFDVDIDDKISLSKDFDDYYEIDLPDTNSREIIDAFSDKGINSLKDLDAKCKLPGFYSFLYYNEMSLLAVYFDGEPVDIYQYLEEDLSEEKIAEYRSISVTGHPAIAPLIVYVMDGSNSVTVDDLDTMWRESHMLYYAFYNAIREGAIKISDGEISQVIAISVTDKNSCAVSVINKEGKTLVYSEGDSLKAHFE